MSSTPFTITSGQVSTIRSRDDFTHFQREALTSDRTMVLLFTSAWHPPCKQMRAVCDTLAVQYPSLLFCEIDAEEVSDVTEEYSSVESVPTTILQTPTKIGTQPKVVDTIPGANVNDLKNAVAQHAKSSGKSPATGGVASTASTAAAAPAAPAETPEELNARLAKLVRASPVMIFIKGTPDAPRCGFTKQLLAILKEQQVQFGSFDILSDQTVRDGLKTFSNWPTYPQVYINGELIGGLDVVKELIAGGEFVEMIPAGHVAVPVASGNLQERLKSLINQHRIMLLMKGSPNAPQCGFSSKAVEMLKEAGVDDYGHFDIFSDEEVREGLKEYSNWPTYPQLYVNGELIGGLDIMKELKENGELASTLEAPPALEK